MKCFKHQVTDIPCLICMKDEYDLYKDDPRHDLSHLIKALKDRGIFV